MHSPNTRYLIGLDHLRAFAALQIVFYHGLHLLSFFPRAAGGDPNRFWIISNNPLLVLLEEGHTAVAMFMVLSGFVLSVSALGKEVAYGTFLKNRFLRIYPLFFFMLLVGSVAHSSQYTFLGVMQALLFQADFQGTAQGGVYAGMFWAVAVEFQFYLLFPFLHRFIERHGARWAVAAIVLCLLMRWMVAINATSNPRDISYWHLLGRLDQFLIGMLSARVYRRFETAKLPWGALVVLSVALVLAVLTVFNHAGGFPVIAMWKIAWPTVEACAWAPLLVTYTLFAHRIPRVISQPLAALGTISYSLYVLHYPCIATLPHLWNVASFSPDPNVASQLFVACCVLPVLLPLSALSYYVIERPFLGLRSRYLVEHART